MQQLKFTGTERLILKVINKKLKHTVKIKIKILQLPEGNKQVVNKGIN